MIQCSPFDKFLKIFSYGHWSTNRYWWPNSLQIFLGGKLGLAKWTVRWASNSWEINLRSETREIVVVYFILDNLAGMIKRVFTPINVSCTIKWKTRWETGNCCKIHQQLTGCIGANGLQKEFQEYLCNQA